MCSVFVYPCFKNICNIKYSITYLHKERPSSECQVNLGINLAIFITQFLITLNTNMQTNMNPRKIYQIFCVYIYLCVYIYIQFIYTHIDNYYFVSESKFQKIYRPIYIYIPHDDI